MTTRRLLLLFLLVFLGSFWGAAAIHRHSRQAVAGEAAEHYGDIIKSAKSPSETVNRVETYFAPPLLHSREEMLQSLNLTVYQEDEVQFFPVPELGMGSNIAIKRAIPVYLEDGGERILIRTMKERVGHLVNERGLLLAKDDQIDPALDAELWWEGRVKITRVAGAEYLAVEDIPYEVETRQETAKFKDETKVIREGQRGSREVRLRVKRENGREVAREVRSEKILEKPVNKVVLLGTRFRPASGRWEDLINEIAPKYFADPAGMTKIMLCESGGNLTSFNPAGPYYGMFQFHPNTFQNLGGHSLDEIQDPAAQIDAAAKLYSARYWHWPVCSRGT